MSYTIKLKKGLNADAKLFLKPYTKKVYESEYALATELTKIMHEYKCPFLIMSLNIYDDKQLIKASVVEDRLRKYLGSAQSPNQYWKLKAKI